MYVGKESNKKSRKTGDGKVKRSKSKGQKTMLDKGMYTSIQDLYMYAFCFYNNSIYEERSTYFKVWKWW